MADQILRLIVTGDVSGATKEMRLLQRDLDKATKRLNAVGDAMTIGVTLPLVGLGAAAFKFGMDYDKSMRQVQAATGASTADMALLDQMAMQMGTTTVYSAQESAAAMLELAKAGITPAQMAAGALEATMQLAAAGQVDMAAAATATTNAMNAFGLAAGDTASIADALAGGANASTASVESLMMGLQQVGASAKLAGLSLQETVGALALFDQAGVKGQDAGTSLKTMLVRLVPATKEASDAMKQYGLDFTDSQGRIVPLTEAAEQLRQKLGPLSQAQRISALTTIFGTDAMRAAAIMTDSGAKGLQKYIQATQEKTAAEKMAAAFEQSDAGRMKMMMASLQTASIGVQKAMAPFIIGLAVGVSNLADAFTKLDPSAQKTIVAIAAVAAAAGPAVKVAGLLTGALGFLHKAYMTQAIAANAAAASTTNAAVAQKAAAAAAAAAAEKQGFRQWLLVGAAANIAAGALVAVTVAWYRVTAGVRDWAREATGAAQADQRLYEWNQKHIPVLATLQSWIFRVTGTHLQDAQAKDKSKLSAEALTREITDEVNATMQAVSAAQQDAGAHDQLTRAMNGTMVAADSLAGKQRTLKDRELDQRDAALALKDAKKQVADAEREHGRGSDEAKQAQINLERAELRAKDAAYDAAKAQKEAADAAYDAAAGLSPLEQAWRGIAREAGNAATAQRTAMAVANQRSGRRTSGPQMAEGDILRARPGGIQVTAAEAGYDEAFIPINNRPRSMRLLAETNRRMGFGGGGMVVNMTFPLIERGQEPKARQYAQTGLASLNAPVMSYGG